MEKYKQSLVSSVDDAQGELDRAKTAWEAKLASTRAQSQAILGDYESRKSRLEADVSLARSTWESAFGDASMQVRKANDARAEVLKVSEDKAEAARREWDMKLKEAQVCGERNLC